MELCHYILLTMFHFSVVVGNPGTVDEFQVVNDRAQLLPPKYCIWNEWEVGQAAVNLKSHSISTLCPAAVQKTLEYQFGKNFGGITGTMQRQVF